MSLWVLSLVEPGGGLSLKSRASGSQVVLGNPNHTEQPWNPVPLPPCAPAPRLASNSHPSQTGGTLWPFGMVLPGSPGLEKGEDFPFLCFIAQNGKRWGFESHETLTSQSPRQIGAILSSCYSG